MASSMPQSQTAMLATITTDLDKIAPRFDVQPDQITIIRTPAEFYQTLKVGSANNIYYSFPSSFP
jgi:CDP-diacylglycerol--glycerol-3-phosphate 3-phosphatidyltransferase